MQFIIVANDDLAPLGRQLAHALSVQNAHSGAFWTAKHYTDNEAQLDGKQPVIFLGENEVSKSYADVLPERFRGYSTRCSYEGAKAVLVADEPDEVGRKELAGLGRVVEDKQKELRQLAAAAAAASASGAAAAGAVGFTLGPSLALSLAVPTAGLVILPVGAAFYAVHSWISARKRRQEYRELQYEYLLSRFLMDEFDAYVAGVQGC